MQIDELALKNAVIGFTVPSSNTWPSPLVNGNYEVVGLERDVFTTQNETLVSFRPEVILSSDSVNSVILWEFKSKSFRRNQANNLRDAHISDLKGQGLTSTKVTKDGSTDPVFVSSAENANILCQRLNAAGYYFPVLSFSPISMKLISGEYSSDFLNENLSEPLAFDASAWPRHFVPFDHDSSWVEMAPPILTTLVHSLFDHQACLLVDIVSKTDPFWSKRGQRNQSTILRKANEMISTATLEELRGFVEHRSVASEFRRVGVRPWSSKSLDTLSDLVTSFCQRQLDGIGYGTGQLRLFPGTEGLPPRT